jgi:hypothetical protein
VSSAKIRVALVGLEFGAEFAPSISTILMWSA